MLIDFHFDEEAAWTRVLEVKQFSCDSTWLEICLILSYVMIELIYNPYIYWIKSLDNAESVLLFQCINVRDAEMSEHSLLIF